MTEAIKLSRVAHGVHASEWKLIEAKRDHPGAGGITVLLRGGLASEFELEIGRLGKYLKEAGTISLSLRAQEERTSAVVIGQIVQMVEALYAKTMQDPDAPDPVAQMVESLTHILHGLGDAGVEGP